MHPRLQPSTLPLCFAMAVALSGLATCSVQADANRDADPTSGACGQRPLFDDDFEPAEACEAYARVLCGWRVGCCIASSEAEERCVANLEQRCNARDLSGRLAAGYLSIDLPTFKQCLSDGVGLECNQLNGGRTFGGFRCLDGVLSANVELEGACLHHDDCMSGRCSRLPETCGGTCSTPLGLGETCDNFSLRCDPEVGFCSGDACSPILNIGDECEDGEQCGARAFCSANLTCQPVVGANEPCGPGDACEPGYACSTTCVPARSIGEGGACVRDSDCQPDLFCDGGRATQFGACAALLPLGASCDRRWECVAGATCIGGVCTAVSEADGLCEIDDDCAFGLLCREQLCSPAGVGAACQTDYECLAPLRCVSEHCSATPAAIGEECRLSEQCDDGAFCDGENCRSRLPGGAACDVADPSGSCLSGMCEELPSGPHDVFCLPPCEL